MKTSFLSRFAILSNVNFRLFWLARVCTALGYQMLTVGVGWKMYDLTGSTFYLGLIGLAQFTPMIILSLMVGHFVDGYDRRTIVRICQLCEALGVLVLAYGSWTHWLNKENLLLIVFVIGAARAFESPALQALLPGLVPAKLFPQAIALSSSSMQTATIIGPALGGLLYMLGSAPVFLAVGALYLIAAFWMGRIARPKLVIKRQPISWSSVSAGLIFIKSQPSILGAISLDLFAVLLGGATALLPVYAREILCIGPVGLGLLRSAPAVGALTTSLWLAHSPLKRQAGKKMFFAVGVFGAATIVFGLSRSVYLSIAALMLLGAADTISVVVRSSLVQLSTPDAMRGRVSAVNFMFIGTSNQLGEFESGMLAALCGTVPSVVLGGIGTIGVALLWMKWFPGLRRLDDLHAIQLLIPSNSRGLESKLD